jgi:hypothetical protein
MIRRVSMLLTGLSLVLCVALVVLWVWSYRAAVAVVREVESAGASSGLVVGASRGTAFCLELRTGGAAQRESRPDWLGPGRWEVSRAEPIDLITDRHTLLQRVGFNYATDGSSGYGSSPFWNRSHLVVFPLWLPTALAAMAPAVRLVRARRRRARRRRDGGFCTRCGYDLTGNLSGTCPECGTRVAEVKGDG